ncbi:DUF4124 domain-containing protein [Aestuariirhabdus litorea]|uniref:DUF4124 domain-containing protein n=1 Tax=Aestuariirhabdus litorea TaxID=2528527 RepID=A0A3P3VNA6_9GAMM|nr:DUF4124 domain-containing protein [Aestuariirhabdus litorea]RRJ83126.1 DUF4124 domain-containing protein [Aestuariirhabdus litorea]RWW93282.1 DUF4124 domain-containing protein [Endozoicomonadaceae bacterium GTF-13]
MMKRLVVLIMAGTLVSTPTLGAQIYRTVDPAGNVTFTDNPPEGQAAEAVKLKPMTTVSPPAVKPLPASTSNDNDKPKDQPFKYDALRILSPEPGETIRGAGDLQVIAATEPEMRESDSARLLIDGKPFDSRQKSLSFALKNVDRGAHTLEVQVVDARGNTLISSRVEVFVHRAALGTPPRPTPRN